MLKKVESISIPKFTKGLNTNSNIFTLEPGQSPAAINVNWDVDGSIQKRLGATSMNTVVLEGTGGWGMYNFNTTLPGLDGYTKLLLHCNGADDATTFTDEMGKTITNVDGLDNYTKICSTFDGSDGATAYTDPARSEAYTFKGTAQLDTAQKKFGTASLLLDGNSDYVTLADSADWDFGTGDFTIEFCIRWNNIGNTAALDIGSGVNDKGVMIYLNGAGIYAYLNGYGTGPSVAFVPVINTWYHIAVTRSGTDLRFFVDGVQQGAAQTNSTNIDASTYGLTVGAKYNGTGYFLNGWIDELRISKGVCRYTANFTPLTIAFGKVRVSTLQKKFSTGSAYFNKDLGVRGYLQTPNSADFNFGTDDFTVDFWARLANYNNSQFCGQFLDANNRWSLHTQDSGKLGIIFVGGGATKASYLTNAVEVGTATWNHLAYVRSGSAGIIYVNGISTTLVTTTSFGAVDVGVVGTTLHIGTRTAGELITNGWVDELRLSKGIARWVANFTPPTDEYSNANYQINRLLCASGTGIYWSTDMGATWTVCGTARSQTRNSFAYVKNYIVNCNDNYDVPLYWTGSSETTFGTIAPLSAPTCKYPTGHQGYFFLLNEANNKRGVYYVDENNMLSSATYSNFRLPTDFNDEITGSFILKKYLYIHTKYKIFKMMFVGGNPDWSYTEVKNWGFVPRTVKKIQIPEVGEAVIGLDYSKRLRIFTGNEDEVISTNIETNNGMTPFYMQNINGSYIEKCWAENDAHQQVYKLYVPYGDSMEATHCLVFNYRVGAFYPYGNQNYQCGAISYDTANGLHMMLADSSGYIYEADVGNTDSGEAVDEYFTSNFMFKKSPVVVSKEQKMYLYFKPTSSGTINYEDRQNFKTTWELRKSLVLTDTSSYTVVEKVIDLPTIANVYQFKVSSSANTNDPWVLNRVDLLNTDLGVGKP